MAKIHVGHARTMLLGKLIADEIGIPFHVRFDGPVSEITGDRGECILDVVSCLSFFGIVPDKIYWIEQPIPPKESLAGIVGAEIDKLWMVLFDPSVCPDYYRCLLLDDSIYYHPSLIVRGWEFSTQQSYHPGSSSEQGIVHVKAEDMVFRALGKEKYEINVPLILRSTEKMSKSTIAAVHWSTLTAVSPELAKAFLISTAIYAHNPIGNIGQLFTVEKMEPYPYRWSWEDFADLCRMES